MGVTAVVPRKIARSNGSYHTPKPMIRMPRLQAASPGDSMRPCSHRTQGSCPLRHTVPSSLGRRSSAPEAMAKAKGATADPGRVVLMVVARQAAEMAAGLAETRAQVRVAGTVATLEAAKEAAAMAEASAQEMAGS